MTIAQEIEEKLRAGLHPVQIEIINDSHKHRGHAGDNGSGESHFTVKVVAAAFAGQSRVTRQRAVYKLLQDELEGPVHALALITQTPEEAGL